MNLPFFPLDEILFTMYIKLKTMSREYTKNMKSKTLDIIALYLLTRSAAYKVAIVKNPSH